MRDLTIDDFAHRIGKAFAVEAGGGSLPLTLAQAQELPLSGRPGGSFRLEFGGPAQPILPQAIYPFRIDGEQHDIFIVPIGPKADGMRYEAIFF